MAMPPPPSCPSFSAAVARSQPRGVRHPADPSRRGVLARRAAIVAAVDSRPTPPISGSGSRMVASCDVFGPMPLFLDPCVFFWKLNPTLLRGVTCEVSRINSWWLVLGMVNAWRPSATCFLPSCCTSYCSLRSWRIAGLSALTTPLAWSKRVGFVGTTVSKLGTAFSLIALMATTLPYAAAAVGAKIVMGGPNNDPETLQRLMRHAHTIPLRALDSTGVGTTGDIAAAFFYAGQMGIDVAVGEGHALGNALSYGGPYVGLFATAEEGSASFTTAST